MEFVLGDFFEGFSPHKYIFSKEMCCFCVFHLQKCVSIYLYNTYPSSFLFFLLLLQFIVECHGNTLLPQFLGMYRLTVDGVEVYMIVTRNVFSHRLSVYRKYDLKVRNNG